VSHLVFKLGVQPRGYVTQVWNVAASDNGEALGQVRWYPSWRRYCFYPKAGTIFDADCLAEIATFCSLKTKDRAAERSSTA